VSPSRSVQSNAHDTLRTRGTASPAPVLYKKLLRELSMALNRRFLTAVALSTGLGIAPAAHAADWHHGGHYHHRGGGNAAGAAVIGGLVGLGVGAAIASGGGYYAPPPVYYGAPGYYYAPAPPSVYYGY
jgi:hypothetical protein